jgi:uncharacterized protein YkwD
MDIRTWQEAGIRAGVYSARHRARSPFSPLRPTPIAIGSLSTAAIAAFAFVAPGILHSPAGSASTVLGGGPANISPLSPGGGNAAPGYVSVTSPSTSSASSDSPAAPASTATSSAAPTADSTSPTPLTQRTPTLSSSSPRPSQPVPSRSQPPPSSPTSPSQSPTTTPTTSPTTPLPTTPTPPPPTTSTTAPFNASAAASSALNKIGDARSQQGVSRLNSDSLLTNAARVHSADMAHTGDFSHIGSDGSDPFSRAADLGCFTLSQELIAHGKPGDDVIGALMRDPSSRRALLSFWNSSIGVSAQLDPATGDVYWSIELGWG